MFDRLGPLLTLIGFGVGFATARLLNHGKTKQATALLFVFVLLLLGFLTYGLLRALWE